MKILFASLWVFLFSLIIFIVSYEAYLSPNDTNHAVSFAMVAFSLINFPVGLLNIINPFWTHLTDIGLSLGLPIAWAEAAHIKWASWISLVVPCRASHQEIRAIMSPNKRFKSFASLTGTAYRGPLT
jgi:hypothetical protein